MLKTIMLELKISSRYLKFIYWIIYCTFYSIVISSYICYAQTISSNVDLQELQLFYSKSELVVTPTRIPTPIAESPAIITVITQKEIRALGARTLKDIISLVPGFDVEINNVGNPVILVRGLRAYQDEKVLLMIDGHVVNEAHSEGFAWSFADMPLGNVKRVEFLCGPGSAVYGKDAYLGVINVITFNAKPISKQSLLNSKFENYVSERFGSFDTSETSALWSHSWDKWSVTFYTRYFHTNGDDRLVHKDLLSVSPYYSRYSIAPAHVEDWQDQTDLDLHVDYEDITTHMRFLHKRQGPYVGITSVLANGSHRTIDDYFLDIAWIKNLGAITPKIRLYSDRFTIDNLWVTYPSGFLGYSSYKQKQKGVFDDLGFEAQLRLNNFINHKIILGITYRVQHQHDIKFYSTINPITLQSLGGFKDISSWANWASRDDNWDHSGSIYAQDTWNITHNLLLTTGLRCDCYFYSHTKKVINPRIGLVWKAFKNTWIKFLYGQAFRAPSFLERFLANNIAYKGNPDLTPEKIYTGQIGIQSKFNNTSVEADIFYSRFKDLIVLGPKPSQNQPSTYENSGRAYSEGFEIALKHKICSSLMLKSNYSFVYTKDEEIDGRSPGAPSHLANIVLEYKPLENTIISSRLFICGRRYRSPDDTRKHLPSYALLDLSLLQKKIFHTAFSCQLVIRNLLNQYYKDPAPTNGLPVDYPRPGRTIYCILRYNF